MHSMKPVANVIKPYLKKNMRALDIGAAKGELLSCIKEDVAYCFGIELNEEYCNFIKNELGIDTSNQDYFEINYDQPFDMIIINSTLDHMYNSLGVLEKIYDDLIPGGLLYIQTPNDEQALKNYLPEEQRFEFQKFMYQKAHYLSFSSSTLQMALEQTGFTVKNLFSRHDYNFKNFLNWYFVGKRQLNIEEAKINCTFFNNRSKFENEMNAMLEEAESKFQNIISRNLAGELLCCFAQRN